MTLQADPALRAADPALRAANSASAASRPDKIAYRKSQPWGMAPDLVVPNAHSDDERLWAPVAPDIWSRPLHLNVSGGHYTHLLRVRRSGVLQRHRHSGAVHAYVMRGRWYYLEHDWVAGHSLGYDDVFTRIEKYRAHFEAVGLGADHVREFMR